MIEKPNRAKKARVKRQEFSTLSGRNPEEGKRCDALIYDVGVGTMPPSGPDTPDGTPCRAEALMRAFRRLPGYFAATVRAEKPGPPILNTRRAPVDRSTRRDRSDSEAAGAGSRKVKFSRRLTGGEITAGG